MREYISQQASSVTQQQTKRSDWSSLDTNKEGKTGPCVVAGIWCTPGVSAIVSVIVLEIIYIYSLSICSVVGTLTPT